MGLRSGFRDWLYNVHVNQDLVIKSPKLGVLHRFMQVVLMISLVIYVWYLHVWMEKAAIVPAGLSAWVEAPLSPSAADTSVRHCTDMAYYRFLYRGSYSTVLYHPVECVAMDGTDGFQKRGDFLMVYTHIIDIVTLRSTNASALNQCGVDSESACAAMRGMFVHGDGFCECHKRHDYLTRNPEEMSLHFHHGYSASLPLGGVEHKRQGEPGLITVFTRHDGSLCQINGRSIVRDTDMTSAGINGTLREFLACAGVSLDDGPKELGTGDTILRNMGLRLDFELHYSNVDREYLPDIVCKVTPHVHVAWTSSYGHDKTMVGQPIGMQSSKHTREAYGIQVTFTVQTDLMYWSIPSTVRGIVTILLIMTIPGVITELIVETCLGSLSKIYLHAKRTHFDLNEQICTAIGRLLIPMMIYRSLVGADNRQRAEYLPRFKTDDMEDQLEDVFAEELKSGRIEHGHIRRMVSLMCDHGGPKKAGKDKDEEAGTMGFRDFGVVAGRNELIDRDMLVTMIHTDRRKSFMERLLVDHTIPTDHTQDGGGVHSEETLRAMFTDTSVTDAEAGSPGRGAKRRTNNLQEASPAPAAGGKEEYVIPSNIEERLQHAERTAQQAMKGLEVALARAKAAEEKVMLAELKFAGRSGTQNSEANPHATLHQRLLAAEQAAQQAREEAQSAVYGVEAMRGSVTELERLSRKAAQETRIAETDQEEEEIIEQDEVQADADEKEKDKKEEVQAGADEKKTDKGKGTGQPAT